MASVTPNPPLPSRPSMPEPNSRFFDFTSGIVLTLVFLVAWVELGRHLKWVNPAGPKPAPIPAPVNPSPNPSPAPTPKPWPSSGVYAESCRGYA
jgi:hypothetical protein